MLKRGGCMFVIVQIFIVLCPLILLFYFGMEIYKFDRIINKRRIIREKQLQFKGIGDFLPRKIKKQLEKDPQIIKRFVNEIIKAYTKVLFAMGIYITFWILYLIGIIIRIIWLFNDHYNGKSPEEYGCIIGSIIMSALMVYWLLLMPIFEFFHLRKSYELGYTIWIFFQYALNEWIIPVFKYSMEFIVSFLVLYGYTLLVKKFLQYFYFEMTFIIALTTLMLYQYGILKALSQILKVILQKISLRFEGCENIKKYIKDNIIYLILKNTTYLSMVVIYAIAVYLDKAEVPMASAIGVLFLIDTFFAQEKAIQEKISSNNLEE